MFGKTNPIALAHNVAIKLRTEKNASRGRLDRVVVMEKRTGWGSEPRCATGPAPWTDAWGRPSFLVFSPSAVVRPRIYDADHSLGTGMDMDVSDFNRLLVATSVPVERLDQLELEPEHSIEA